MRRSFVASAILSLLLASAAWAQDPDECQRWSVEVQNSETYDLSVHVFRGDRVPPKVYQTELGRLRGRFLRRVRARSNETLELPAGMSLIWIEPVGSEHALQDKGWSESSAIVASPTRRTRLTQVRIRAEFTCLDDPK
jgi:hypothetical protein